MFTCWNIYLRNKVLMTVNKLKLNYKKTKSPKKISKFNQQVNLFDHQIKVARKFRYHLTIIFTWEIKFGGVCPSVYFHVRNINSIKKALSNETTTTVIHVTNGHDLTWHFANWNFQIWYRVCCKILRLSVITIFLYVLVCGDVKVGCV